MKEKISALDMIDRIADCFDVVTQIAAYERMIARFKNTVKDHGPDCICDLCRFIKSQEAIGRRP